MSWEGIVGHDDVVDQFRHCLQRGRMASTFLFVGPQGIGKRTFALKLAQGLLCTAREEGDLAPCGTCAACQQVTSDSHPDLQVVAKPAERAFIPVETFIGDREHRMRTGLCHFMSLTPTGGKRRIAIVDDADWLNQEGANSLLKTLEEPSPGAVIILITTSLQRQLPTIRSRSQVIRFQPLATAQVADCLQAQGMDAELAHAAAACSGGSIQVAQEQANESVVTFRRELWQELAASTIDRAQLADVVNQFAESAGKENAAKRGQLRLAFEAAAHFFRSVARQQCDAAASDDAELANQIIEYAAATKLTAESATSLVERSLEAIRHTQANANLPMIVDAWANDLAVSVRTGQACLFAYQH